ncbi:ABC transporter ATP-binding protein [Peloplasma aerotolerans]|uniref:ATP-binding cassette domain-containing protein n=1 Tax=Peloplasma aerotolerans TaxID=3044389 RepID=A0AAW6U2Z1_9MOLU|nr:ATP-binding cassette domain-containing protein [Mariniplasma sp. M4Ah]MDI6452257.1 ATP-binding cassette domain-containing protein [Mariniplasma sp. M4Ah]MDR4968500.1 ATP-binding cassette domain-containing protein [Acholeplasmataceae bacterium]
MLEVKNARMLYGDLVAVDRLSFIIKPGDIFGLLGTNGAGKTTTFRMIMGLLDPTEGEILYNGEKVGYHNVNEIGYMIEERSLLTKITVKELMLYFGQLKDMEPKAILERLDYWLERFDIVDYKDKKIKELSKGNQQKIQFISAIINNPKLLVLDEPFSGLDPINTELFVEVIRDFQKQGAMVVFSSHQLDHVESFCEEVIVLEKGKAVIEGRLDQVKIDFKKQNIRIIGDVDIKKLEAIPGVDRVIENSNEIIVKIESELVAKHVFDYIKTCDHIMKYDVEQASLSEIFIAKVGHKVEKV